MGGMPDYPEAHAAPGIVKALKLDAAFPRRGKGFVSAAGAGGSGMDIRQAISKMRT